MPLTDTEIDEIERFIGPGGTSAITLDFELIGRLCVEIRALRRSAKAAEQERDALREAEAEMRNRAAQVVDWYFTTYFSKSPGSESVDELMQVIRRLPLRAALAGAPQDEKAQE